MVHRKRTGAVYLLTLCSIFALTGYSVRSVEAAPVGKAARSIAQVPADASFYTASLRNREQLDRFLASNAWKKLRALPAVDQAWNLFLNEYNNPFGELAQFRAFVEAEENQELFALLLDAWSHESFTYGGKDWPALLNLYFKLNTAMNMGPAITRLEGGRVAEPFPAREIMHVLLAEKDKLKVPELVCGFRLTDTKKATNQIARLETLANQMAKQAPPLKGRIKRVKVGDSSFLTLQLDGSMVPWEEIPIRDLESKPGELDPLIKHLKGLTLTIALGVKDDFLLFSIGSSTEHLARLGKGKVLADRPELAVLSKSAGKPLVRIAYSSKALMAAVNEYSLSQLTGVARLARAGLKASDLPAAKQQAINQDIRDFVAEVRAAIPEPGAVVAFSYLTERGSESYTYQHGSHPRVDSSAPLTILDHLGGKPILAVAGRSKGDLAGYLFLAKWAKKAYGHVDELLRSTLPPDEREQYVKASKALLPIVAQLDEVTQKLFLPSFDGQFALVFDARWKSKQWYRELPATPVAMPLPELGLVFGVKDPAKLRQAGSRYRQLANELIAALRKVAPPVEIPPFELPPPQEEKSKVGSIYYYPLPKEAGLDDQVQPNAALSEKVAVITLSRGHSARLLTPTPLTVKSTPLGDGKKNISSASVFDFPALVDALEPWVLFGTRIAEAQAQRELGEDIPPGFRNMGKQVGTLLDILRCYKGRTSVSYLEKGVLVTHSESVFQDLEK
jgi:hypothetical protein